ncbi:hypothetical protein GCK72_024464 [Caenorhabditis remanei]|uniref:Calcineurin-like phosphoesterase domain-containing protein n=2 Tax=Caenorhabditis remanei TaxID=31234 RepID=A0A6A5FZE1_CAERE|nr:hypothetical protein GCK72_024464 [Caenorhabditis remanei]KAF1747997.1 hypothetical protein GCK72_024464 [Caenorhabditis remanei]
MGDTQFHFPCEEDNVQCKLVSKRPRSRFFLNSRLEFIDGVEVNETLRQGRDSCTKIESRFANRVQRQALDALISSMDYKPAALVINGDLTDFGHLHQLHEFRQVWYNNFPIPFILGLGNHDYQNNINDCALNFCAHTMLSWYTDYVKNMSLVADIQRKTVKFDVEFTGSLAYTETVCSSSRKLCAFVIQLNNAIDYNVEFSSLFVKWNISSPMKYLHNELNLLGSTSLPILLNMHQCESMHIHKIKMMLRRWMSTVKKSFESNHRVPRIGAFYAHMHQRHEVTLECIEGYKVPFVYIGSVPNNRFTKFDMTASTATITGYKARDSLMYNGEILEQLETVDLWGPCVRTEHFRFEDHVTRKRRDFIRRNRNQADFSSDASALFF